MKKFIYLLFSSLAMISCKKNFLDPKLVNTVNTEAGTFTDSARTVQFVNGIYNNIYWTYAHNRYNGGGNLAGAIDEAVNRDNSTSNQANHINQATLTAVNIGSGSALTTNNDRGYWLVYWMPIRAANIAIKNVPDAPIPMELKNRLLGEARFLRAYYYFTLMKYYGGVPIIGDKVFDPEEGVGVPRNSFAETVNYIVAECEAAEKLLYNGSEVIRNSANAQIFDGPGADNGRITKGACLALKAKTLLYAASPLFNGGNISLNELNGYSNPEYTGYLNYDAERWKKAYDAQEAVVSSNQYALKVDNTTAPGYGFYSVFVTRPTQSSPEFILSFMRANNNVNETQYDVPSRGNAAPSTFPYQELVDAFPMKNGKAINEAGSGFDASNPYANRDPRFDFTILHNESMRRLQSANALRPVYTYLNAPQDGYKTGSATTTTGYYVFKTLDKDVTRASGNSPRCDGIIRYAEVVLGAAEALNEYAGPTSRVYDLLKQIRLRAGITPGNDGLYGIPSGLDKTAMRNLIQNERRIELAFEDQRIWDIHRWKIGEQTMNKTQHGMQVEMKVGGGYTYTQINANQTRWLPRLYLFPFSQYEVARNPLMKQNPGWN
ncbi:RagB/SusD family nutrient uptake outer membrane protein [Pedobacter frigidisoli]|uniref:RagB/SusD family nutrient uptake outer membrane protein n=1 Tax=Pedobacter frigidisoli TaxID=2530455 RepID=UPI00292D10E2|nr:RagB/SusD family nutrient uptake outer membrane protein [Pedobacter frigidisoli]